MKDLASRTREFAVCIVRFFATLPKTTEAQVIGKQMLRAGMSVGAHYREATRSRSNAEFVSKIEAGLQELEETQYWIEILRDVSMGKPEDLSALAREADELTAILVTVVKKRKAAR
ncbi:MAG TPA: four helix bundle protein [Vicinamibacterales bacterium]|jgi:four helix bundle protein